MLMRLSGIVQPMNTHATNAQFWITHLQLSPHPEGGYFKETYRSSGTIPQSALPANFLGERAYCTGIYYLLEQNDFSAFHRIRSDEMWHFYGGGSLDLHVLHQSRHQLIRIGAGVDRGERLQWIVPAGAWFAARPTHGSSYVLAGCTVSPGFDFADFELGTRAQLYDEFPQYQNIIDEFTRT